LTSGPVILFLALDQGTAFAAVAAQAILLGMISVGVFCLSYGRLARRWPWPPTLLAGWGLVFLSTSTLSQISLALVPAAGAVGMVLGGVFLLLPDPPGPHPAIPLPRWELPVRMGIAAGFVVLLTSLAQV